MFHSQNRKKKKTKAFKLH